MLDLTNSELIFALEAVRQASLLVRKVQAEMVSPALTKEDRSPVTVADFASQAVIGRLLEQAFPADPMVAEEDSAALRQETSGSNLHLVTQFVSRFQPDAQPQDVCDWIDHARVDTAERFWTLDPIDGTKGFLRKDQYAVALALVIDGVTQVGVLGCPNLSLEKLPGEPETSGSVPAAIPPGLLVAARRGQGAWASPLEQPRAFRRLHVSRRSNPAEARILRSFESGHTNVSQIDLFAQALGVQADPVRLDSQAKYAILAAGSGELMLRLLSASQPNYKEKIWDQAAGSLILEEAGGRISDLQGRPLDFTTGRELRNNRGLLASNGLLHEAALEALQKIGAA